MSSLLYHPEDKVRFKDRRMFHTSGISIGTLAAITIGGAALSAGGAIAASAINANATKGANAAKAKSSKTYTRDATKEATKGYKEQNKNIDAMLKRQQAENAAYRAAVSGNVGTYRDNVNTMLGTSVDYSTGLDSIVEDSKKDKNDFDAKSLTLAEDSANQVLNYNTENLDKYIQFSDALSQANANTAQRMMFANNPGMERQQQQAMLLNEQGMNAMISTDTQALLARRSAQMGGQSGTGFGSELKNNFELRDLGLTAQATQGDAQKNMMALRGQIYDQTVAGRQVGSEKILGLMGLNTEDVLSVNQKNNALSFGAAQDIGTMRFNGLNKILDTRFASETNATTWLNNMEGSIFGENSSTNRYGAGLKSSAITARTNAILGITGEARDARDANTNASLANSYNSAAMLNNGLSSTGGSMTGIALSSALKGSGGSTGSGGSAYAASVQPGATSMQDLNLSGINA